MDQDSQMKRKPVQTEYTSEELDAMLDQMQEVAKRFYSGAVSIGFHQFVEFAGFLNEFIKICTKARERGIDFATTSVLPINSHHAEYIAEKLNCIFGPSLLESKELRDAFIDRLFEGQYRLTEGIVLAGWDCRRCGAFNGEGKESRTVCRCCDAPIETVETVRT
jgi:rubrerythrin